MRAHKWHGENQTVMLFNLPQPMGLVAVHPARQPAGIAAMLLWGRLIYTLKPNKITPLMTCMCGLTTFRRKPLFEESLFSHLPAFCCGTSILLMCLPLRLDAGSRPNHLQSRYAWREAVISAQFDYNWKSDQMHLMGWSTLLWDTHEKSVSILEKRRDIFENTEVVLDWVKCFWQFPVCIHIQAVFHHHKF